MPSTSPLSLIPMRLSFERGNEAHYANDSIIDANVSSSQCSERDEGNENATSAAHTTLDSSDPPGHPMITRAKDSIHKPKKFLSDFKLFITVKTEPTEPINTEEALNSTDWK